METLAISSDRDGPNLKEMAVVRTCPEYYQMADETAIAKLWRQAARPRTRLDKQVPLGSSLAPSSGVGAGPRWVDLATANPLQERLAECVEIKPMLDSGRMDAALGALVYERELAAQTFNIPRTSVRPVAVFGDSDFDFRSPEPQLPQTIRTWMDVADRLGVQVWVGTDDGFVRVTDICPLA